MYKLSLRFLRTTTSPEQWWMWYRELEKSRLVDVFVGQLRSSLTCGTCGHCSVTFDPFWELSVSLPTRVSPLPYCFIPGSIIPAKFKMLKWEWQLTHTIAKISAEICEICIQKNLHLMISWGGGGGGKVIVVVRSFQFILISSSNF